MKNALVRAAAAVARPAAADFDFSGFQVFTSVPSHPSFGIVALGGMVIVYDEGALRQEGIVADSFYVRESQRPPSGMTWETWLLREREDQHPRVGPASPLAIRREVVQAIRWPYEADWSVRLPGGQVDGPYYDWAFGTNFIGKVAGIYLPATSTEGC